MNTKLLTLAVAPALVAPLLLSGKNASAEDPGLVRIQAKSRAAQDVPDAANWKDRLSDKDLGRREAAFDQFVEALRRDPALRREAESWRKGYPDQELSWTSRLALREAQEDGVAKQRRTPNRVQPLDRNDLQSRLEEMQRRFDDFERRLNSGLGGAHHGISPWWQQNGMTQGQQSYTLQMTPDGVKVEVEENVGGKQEKKTYEARTLDELLEAHPELKDKIGGGGIQVFPGRRSFFGEDDANDPFAGPLPPAGGNRTPLPLLGGMRTDRLGVGIGDLTADERHAAQLDADVGLEVASIEPGSVASKIGLEVGDVIVEVNGRVVHGAPDVLETLAQRKSDQDIVVTIVDQDHKKRTLTWRAPSAPAEKPAREKREY